MILKNDFSADKNGILIMGGGAAGLAAAAGAGISGKSCLIIDRNKKPGNKLYATGNGRCNLANAVFSDLCYYGNSFPRQVFQALYRKKPDLSEAAVCTPPEHPANLVISFFRRAGVQVIGRNGYFYPESLQASTVVWALTDILRAEHSRILTGMSVTRIRRPEKKERPFRITLSDGQTLEAGKIILTPGSPAQPKLGAASPDALAELLPDLPMHPFRSALCPVFTKEDLTPVRGVRVHARLKIRNVSETGELQLTDKGLSGIVVFNLAAYCHPGESIEADLIPDRQEEEFRKLFQIAEKNMPERRISAFLNGMIPDKLAVFLLKGVGAPETPLRAFRNLPGLYRRLKHWTLTVADRGGFESAQALSGGIPVSEINPETMELKNIPGIYTAGEITDVLGKCGGYNLMYAFLSGLLAGISAGEAAEKTGEELS